MFYEDSCAVSIKLESSKVTHVQVLHGWDGIMFVAPDKTFVGVRGRTICWNLREFTEQVLRETFGGRGSADGPPSHGPMRPEEEFFTCSVTVLCTPAFIGREAKPEEIEGAVKKITAKMALFLVENDFISRRDFTKICGVLGVRENEVSVGVGGKS